MTKSLLLDDDNLEDFLLCEGLVTFLPGSVTGDRMNFAIMLIPDARIEAAEQFDVFLESSLDVVNIISPSRATITILSPDCKNYTVNCV